MSQADARKMLGPTATFWMHQSQKRANVPTFVLVQSMLSLIAFGVMGAVEWSHARTEGAEPAQLLGPRPVGTTDVGYLRVVARPWAQISIDGTVVDTTPTVRAFPLAPGAHYVRLTNPAFVTEDRMVDISRDATVWIDVDMAPAGAGGVVR